MVRYALAAADRPGDSSRSARSTYYYVSFSRLIDARLHGERERTLPRVYARPIALRQGQAIGQQELIVRLNDLGYAQRGGRRSRPANSPSAATPSRSCRDSPPSAAASIRVVVSGTRAPTHPAHRGRRPAAGPTTVQLDAPLLTALMTSGGREKRRSVPLATIPKYVAAGGAGDRGSGLLLASRHQSVPPDRRRA